MTRQPPSCFGMALSPEHHRLGSGGVRNAPSIRPASVSFLRLSAIMLVCCKAERDAWRLLQIKVHGSQSNSHGQGQNQLLLCQGD